MTCKNCGGAIRFKNGIGVCENCNSNYRVDALFENNEVCILSVNKDARGAKTKDCHIARELYGKLESSKINTFFEEASAGDLFAEEVDKLRAAAIVNSKIILLVGASEENFRFLYEKYYDIIKEKKIIPVYLEVKIEKLPSEISRWQAINYDSIGSDKDLIKGVLALLGRYDQIDFLDKQKKAKKKKALFAGIIFAIIALGIAAFLIYNFSKPKEDTEIAAKTSQQIYDEAQDLIADGNYSDAIDLLLQIIDYKESKSILKRVYDNYDGYYTTEDGSLVFYVNIQGTDVSTISLTRYISNDITISFEETVTFDYTTIVFEFQDSSLTHGSGTIELKNDGLILKTSVSGTAGIGNIDQYFKLNQKSSAPADREKDVNRELIDKLLSKRYTLSEVEQMGYTIEYDDTIEDGGGWNQNLKYYRVNDSDVVLLFNWLDVNTPLDVIVIEDSDYTVEDPYLYAIIAPAGIAYADKIGDTIKGICFEGDYIYGSHLRPIDLYSCDKDVWSFPVLVGYEDKTIDEDTEICIMSKHFYSEERYNHFVKFYHDDNDGKHIIGE